MGSRAKIKSDYIKYFQKILLPNQKPVHIITHLNKNLLFRRVASDECMTVCFKNKPRYHHELEHQGKIFQIGLIKQDIMVRVRDAMEI